MSSKLISDRKVKKGSQQNIQSNIFDSQNIIDRDNVNNNSFLPDIKANLNQDPSSSNNANMRYKSTDLKEIKESKEHGIRVAYSNNNIQNGSNNNLVSITPLPQN